MYWDTQEAWKGDGPIKRATIFRFLSATSQIIFNLNLKKKID